MEVVPIGLPSLQVHAYHGKINHEALFEFVTFLEEKREMAAIQATTY